jgi:hypothetical protein
VSFFYEPCVRFSLQGPNKRGSRAGRPHAWHARATACDVSSRHLWRLAGPVGFSSRLPMDYRNLATQATRRVGRDRIVNVIVCSRNMIASTGVRTRTSIAMAYLPAGFWRVGHAAAWSISTTTEGRTVRERVHGQRPSSAAMA